MSLLARLSDAETHGASIGETELTFRPGSLRPGEYEADIGTAGSVTLVCDAVLPLICELSAPIRIEIRGGTNVKWAPTAPYYRHVKLPLLWQFGLAARLDVARHGFYPRGDGVARLRLLPSQPHRIVLPGRASIDRARVYSLADTGLAEAEVAERQRREAVDRVSERDIPVVESVTTHTDAPSPGSAILVRLEGESALAGFDAVGERGLPAEDVAGRACEQIDAFCASPAGIDAHMGDQLLAILAVVGGRVIIPRVTDHVRAQLQLLDAFDIPVELDRQQDSIALVADGLEKPYSST